MRTHVVAIAAVLVSSVAAAPRPKLDLTPASELKLFQGTWLYTNQTSGGRALDPRSRDRIWVEVDGDIMTKTGVAGSNLRYKIVLDPTTSPKTIDLVSHQHPSGKTFVQKGIYEWDGEALRLCLDNSGKERP